MAANRLKSAVLNGNILTSTNTASRLSRRTSDLSIATLEELQVWLKRIFRFPRRSKHIRRPEQVPHSCRLSAKPAEILTELLPIIG